jgi:zinc transport system substrate-binding protein
MPPLRRRLCTAPVAALLAGLALLTPVLPAAAEPLRAAPKVVTTVKPLHSLVASVMAGLGEPELLLAGGGSPHAGSLRPSQARALDEAELVFWIGPELEAFLAKPLEALAGNARVIALTELPGLERLEARTGGAWNPAEQDDHKDSPDGGQPEGGANPDPHLWLDPDNARAIAALAAAALSEADPDNAARYALNAAAVAARIEALDRELTARLAPLRDRPFIVFHDAYQYLERHYGLRAAGAIAVSPERAPGARRLLEIRAKIETRGAVCLFSEPQFEPALVETVIGGTAARSGELDPLGAGLSAGPEAYFQLMRGLADSLAACLAPAS